MVYISISIREVENCGIFIFWTW